MSELIDAYWEMPFGKFNFLQKQLGRIFYTGAVSENPRQNESEENMILRRLYLKDLENFTPELWEGNSMGADISFLRIYGT